MQDNKEGTTAWSQPRAAPVHSGKTTEMHLNEDQVSGHQSASASDTLGVWAVMLVFTFKAVKALESRNFFKRADRNPARLPFSTGMQWIKSQEHALREGFCFCPPVKTQSLSFTHTGTNQTLLHPSPFSALFHPLFLSSLLWGAAIKTYAAPLSMTEQSHQFELQQWFGRLKAGFPIPSKGI